MNSNCSFCGENNNAVYVELRAEGYYFLNSPIPLGCLVRGLNKGLSVEQIREQYSTLTIEQVFGGLAFYLSHSSEVGYYMSKNETSENDFSRTLPVKTISLLPAVRDKT